MRNKILILLMALCSSAVLIAGGPPASEAKSYHKQTCRTDFATHTISDGSDVHVVMQFVQQRGHYAQEQSQPWQLTFSNVSPGGYHYTFVQTYAGLPVFGSEVMVNVNRRNEVYSIFDDSYDMSGWHPDMSDFDYQGVAAYRAYVQQYFGDADVKVSATKTVAVDESTATPELCYLVNLRDALGHQRNALVGRDRIIYERDACMYRAAPPAPSDSLVTGMVFVPDPLTHAHVSYYGPYLGVDSLFQNFNDADTPALNAQRVQRSFHATYDSGVFYLRNQYVQLVQLGVDASAPVTSTTPSFDYTRSQNGFLDVMVYYHLNTMRDYVHSLGFNAADTLIMPDPHAFTQDDDFFAQPDNIYYGTGGVPDCQDADVIVHEYTHFLSWNANHSNNSGASAERQSIDEGSADYNGTSYSCSIDTFHWYNMFTWDGHNEYWPGRYVKDPTVYPAIPTAAGLNGIYKYSVIWSSALMEIYFDIGKGPADSLFFETLYGLGSNITLRDAAQQYIKADSNLYNGRYHCTIVQDFYNHGLAWDSACGIWPLGVVETVTTSELIVFTAYPDGFKAVSTQSADPVSITLYDITGQRIATYANVSSEIRPSLPDGIYIVDVSSGGVHEAFKWAKVK